MSRPRRYRFETPDAIGERLEVLTGEVIRLRKAVERNQRALMTAKDAAVYVGYSDPVFRDLVVKKVIHETKLTDELEPRFSRDFLDGLIANRTAPRTQGGEA